MRKKVFPKSLLSSQDTVHHNDAPADQGLVSPTETRLSNVVASLAVESWRMERRLQMVNEPSAQDAMRPIAESIVRVSDLLKANGIEIRDHTGEQYTDGHQVRVIYIDEPGENLWVVQTVEPSVLIDSRTVRQGQVVLSSRRNEASNS